MGADGADRLVAALTQRGNGSLLRGWRRELDPDGSLDVGFNEFCCAALRLGVAVDAEALFGADSPESLTLEELAPEEGRLVERFRRWMTETFGGPGEMFINFEGVAKEGGDGRVPREIFADGCIQHGFDATFEELGRIFELLDVEGDGCVQMENIMFLETDRRRREGAILKAKMKDRREIEFLLRKTYREDIDRFVSSTHRRAPRGWHAATMERLPAVIQERRLNWRRRVQEKMEEARNRFHRHIRERYGNGVRAWRQGLDPHGRFYIRKKELGRYCRAVNLDVDVSSLWHALDQDGDGTIRLEEVASGHAVTLARFGTWARSKFGTCSAAWERLRLVAMPSPSWKSDKTLPYSVFLQALAAHGWSPVQHSAGGRASPGGGVGATLCAALDMHGCGIVSMQDLEWLEGWQAPEWLSADPDPQAWAELRAAMLRVCRQPLRAWRTLLDTDDTNHANFNDFKMAAKKVGFHGNVAGAWRHIDVDATGTISLQEYDRNSAEVLSSFKDWVETNFGSVEFAFRSMDTDGSGAVAFSELKRACARLGWQGSARQIFEFLDVDVSPGKRTLSYKELAFLDSWAPMTQHARLPEAEEKAHPSRAGSKSSVQFRSPRGASTIFTATPASRFLRTGSFPIKALDAFQSTGRGWASEARAPPTAPASTDGTLLPCLHTSPGGFQRAATAKPAKPTGEAQSAIIRSTLPAAGGSTVTLSPSGT